MPRWSLLLLAAAVLAACQSADTPSSGQRATEDADTSGVQGQPVRADIERVREPAADAQQVAALVDGTHQFAFELYRTITKNSADNLIFSPYSISQAFSMVYAGARGETEAQMAQVLGYLPQAAQHPAFNALDQQLAQLDQSPTQGQQTGDAFQLKIANAVWGQQGVPFRQPYLETLAQHYGAGLQAVDFAQNAEQVRQAINAWVAKQTAERITDLMPTGSIDPSTRLVLANAIYFKASWLFPFPEDATQDGSFATLAGEQVSVPLMHQTGARVPYFESAEYQAALLPYLGRTAELVLLVPRAGQFAAVEQQLDAALLAEVRRQATEHDVRLTLPRFDFKSRLDLKQLLSDMGMPTPFGAADFSGMVDGGGLFISAALHQATITVDEQGTEATAATGIAVASSAYPVAELTVDRPFIVAIVARETGSLLFLGRVANPAAS